MNIRMKHYKLIASMKNVILDNYILFTGIPPSILEKRGKKRIISFKKKRILNEKRGVFFQPSTLKEIFVLKQK